MKSVDYVDSRMMVWLKWVLARDDGGLGFPKQCGYCSLVQRSGGAGFQPEFESDAVEIDNILSKLKQKDESKWRALMLHFDLEFVKGKANTVRLTGEQKAERLGVKSRNTVGLWVSAAKRFVEDELHDNALRAYV